VGLVLLSPILVLTAVLIKLESRGPAFFCQERMGWMAAVPMIQVPLDAPGCRGDRPGWTVENDPG